MFAKALTPSVHVFFSINDSVYSETEGHNVYRNVEVHTHSYLHVFVM